jgi:hypothetical protein
MSGAQPGVIYWDTSAIVSALFRDRHSDTASAAARAPGTHLMSSLGWAEVHAVIAVAAARETVERDRGCVSASIPIGSRLRPSRGRGRFAAPTFGISQPRSCNLYKCAAPP